ncbi:MAG: prepilin-type N-terminal cleavage/methylation domain-containing protein [Desulfobulbaceae bacterium]|nr:prepilin-type N-terminal cleavage/methylation domain-containing protein [Desulfobulbaceae bacterium]
MFINKFSRGFTLFEVIITLLVVSTLGLSLYTMMGTLVSGSSTPLVWLGDQLELNGVMEKITADHENYILNQGLDLTGFKDRITNGNVDTNTPYYGEYTVQYNDFILFDSSNTEIPGGADLLKVSIGRGEFSITALFSQ